MMAERVRGALRYWLKAATTVLATGASGEPLRELAVHHAVKVSAPPVIDGRLDEPCWARAPAFTRYRHDGGRNPQSSDLRVVWGDRGIAFGVASREANPERIRASVRTRDGGHVWADDSTEFYLDPTATGYTLFKFDVNCIGTIADFWQPDPGFVDLSWSASSARAAGVIGTDVWTTELFVSWADLGKKPVPGDVWKFYHRRLAWTGPGGKLTVTSTTGGNYTARIFGYLYFMDGSPPMPLELGAKLQLAPVPWTVPIGEQWLWASADGQLRCAEPQAVVEHYRREARRILDTARDLTAGVDAAAVTTAGIAALEKRFAAAADQTPADAGATYHGLIQAGKELRDELALQKFLANAR